MPTLSDLERRILRLLSKPTTRDDMLGGIPTPDEPGGGYSDAEIKDALDNLMSFGRVLFVRAPRRKAER